MGWWTARAGWSRRIGLLRAERLLAGREGAYEAGLAALLSDAAGPARPRELHGEPDIVAAFRRLRSAGPSTVDGVTAVSIMDLPRPRTPLWRSSAVRLTVIVVLLAAAGTATVQFGYLPSRMQPVPPVPSTAPVAASPSASTPAPSGPLDQPRPSITAAPNGAVAPPAAPTSTREAGSAPKLTAQSSTTTADVAEATQLCRMWTDPNSAKSTRDAAAQRLRELMDVLDGPNGMPAFCKQLLGPKMDKKG